MKSVNCQSIIINITTEQKIEILDIKKFGIVVEKNSFNTPTSFENLLNILPSSSNKKINA